MQAGEIGAVQELCRAYRNVLVERCTEIPEIVETYYSKDAYEELLTSLPEKHKRPDGEIFVGVIDGKIEACGMIHRINATTCEIKRVYVSDAARGHGLAKEVFNVSMKLAKELGYDRMVLDTMIRLHEAIGLYKKLGFTQADPFYELDPRFTDYIRFFGKDL